MNHTSRLLLAVAMMLSAAGLTISPGCADRPPAESPTPTTATAPSTPTAPSSAPATATAPAIATTAATAPATPPAVRRVHVFVTGRVQGVGFRAYTRFSALPLKLTGWVRNLRDGRVEAVIEGPPSRVDELLAKIRQGPRASRVEKVEVAEEKATGEFETFEVRR